VEDLQTFESISIGNTTVCDEVTYVCLTIPIAKKIRRAPPNAPVNL
jgi:hypothetical protein